MSLLGGAFRGMAPALALSLLDPQLTWGEADSHSSVQQGVTVVKGDGQLMTPYDLKRLQVRG
jgi:N-acetyltransferase 10